MDESGIGAVMVEEVYSICSSGTVGPARHSLLCADLAFSSEKLLEIYGEEMWRSELLLIIHNVYI